MRMVGVSMVYDTARWYVVHTRPHNEARAVFHLRQQGFRTFCPYSLKTVRHARKAEKCQAPLFPNYLFLNLNIELERWRSVNGTFGVVRILMQNERPLPVPVGVVEALRSRVGSDGVIDFTPKFVVGQDVKLNNGPFTDFVGKLEALDDLGRVRVLLDIMGRGVAVSAKVELLSSVG